MKRLLTGMLLGSLALLGLAGCFSLARGHGPVDAVQFLASRNPGLDRTVTGVIDERADPVEVLMVVPPDVIDLNLVATFSLNTEAVISVVSGGAPVVQQNGVTRNDFSSPVLYRVQVPKEREPWRYRVSVRYAETNAALSRISIPEGYPMTPLFSPRVKSYTVEVPYSVTRVRIDAAGQSQTLRNISIDGVSSGGPSASTSVDFSSGSSRIVSIETLAEDGATRDRYSVTLRRLAADSNAKLDWLEIADTTLVPGFSPARTAYQVEVPFNTTEVVVKARPQSRYATVTLQTLAVFGRPSSGRITLGARGTPADRTGAVVDFTNGTVLPLIVAVTAEDGGVQEYLVEIQRAEPDHNNALADLAVAGSRMSPAFNPRVFRYAVEVPYATRQIVLSARAQSPWATMELMLGLGSVGPGAPQLPARSDLAARGGVTVDFGQAERIVLTVAVTAQDGRSAQYLLDVRRAPPDRNADLGALTVSAGVLSPIFSPRVVSYAVSLPSSIDSVRIAASAAAETATVAVEGFVGRPAPSQAFTVSVAPGAIETVNLVVTAEDGTQKLYRIRVSREATGPVPGRDPNTRLARLQLVGAQLLPNFDPRILEYQAELAANVPAVTLIAIAESPRATVVVDGQPVAGSGRVIALDPGTMRTVVVEVMAESGNVARTVLRLSRERSGPSRDTNTRLSRLQLSGGDLNPDFDPRVLAYQATVPPNVDAVLLVAAPESPAATITVDGQPLGRAGRVISLEPRVTRTVILDVTAEAGNSARTTIRLSREAPRDSNSRLSRLQLSGADLRPDFDPRVLDYQARLDRNADAVTLSASAESPAATITVDGQPLGRAGRVIAVDPGATRTVILDVTAEAGNSARTTIRLSREAGGGGTPPPVTPGNSVISVTLDGVKIARRELAALGGTTGAIGDEARFTVRTYRTNTVIAQGTARTVMRMQGGAPSISAQWRSPGVRLDQGRLVEIEVAIPAGGNNWLFYAEARPAAPVVEVDVPFLLFTKSPRVSWPAIGSPVSVTGSVQVSDEGPRKGKRQPDADTFALNQKGEYGVDVTIADARTGRSLGSTTLWDKPGLARGRVLTFTRPLNLPEGAEVRYTLTARAKNGRGWTASGTTQVWTTKLAYEGGFEPVILEFEEGLAPQD